MPKAAIPFDESLRLQALQHYQILDSDPEQEFDDLAELAAEIYGCPMAAISFVDQERQWFKARKNLPVTETHRDISFCAHAVLEDDLLLVNDARQDERFADNPDVTGGLDIGFYAGAPIRSSEGFVLGTVCVIDKQPRTLKPGQLQALTIIAQRISQLLELGRMHGRMEAALNEGQSLLQLSRRLHEAERKQIAYALHEQLAQQLTVVRLYLEMAETDSPQRDGLIAKSREKIEEVISGAKTLTQEIVPTTLAQRDLLELASDLVADCSRRNGIDIRLDVNKKLHGCTEETGLTLYRLIQQGIKDGLLRRATTISLKIRQEEEIEWTMCDNGQPRTQLPELVYLLARLQRGTVHHNQEGALARLTALLPCSSTEAALSGFQQPGGKLLR